MTLRIKILWGKLAEGLSVKKILLLIAGAMICSFGIPQYSSAYRHNRRRDYRPDAAG